MIRTGTLDRFVTIQRATATQSDSGEPIEAWTTVVLRRPASWWPIAADERFNAPQVIAREQVEFRIHYSDDVADLTPRDRVIYPALTADSPLAEPANRNIYDIIEATEINRREGIKIKAARRTDAIG